MSARVSRRSVLKLAAAAVAADAVALRPANAAEAKADAQVGVLVDTTLCVGCRRCELACTRAHGFPEPSAAALDDPAAFDQKRRPEARAFTVVNRHRPEWADGRQAYVKLSCMHCVEPACVSACLVSAITKLPLP